MASKEIRVIDIIEKKAGSNIFLQGLSGALGFPFTAAADVAVFFTHYGPMLNDIRAVYGLGKVDTGAVLPVVKGAMGEVVADLVVDKVIGNIPLIGLPANMICAKAMTWRLGILFGMLSARGEEVTEQNVQGAIKAIRQLFPQTSSLLFQKPSAKVVEKLLTSVEGITSERFDDRVMQILDALA